MEQRTLCATCPLERECEEALWLEERDDLCQYEKELKMKKDYYDEYAEYIGFHASDQWFLDPQ